MFYGCNELTSLNLNNFDIKKATDISLMFYYCNHLQILDISSFETNITNVEILSDLSEYGIITVNTKFYEKIKNQIPTNWKIVIN